MKIKSQEMKIYQIFVVPIGNAKVMKKMEFHPRSLVIKDYQE